MEISLVEDDLLRPILRYFPRNLRPDCIDQGSMRFKQIEQSPSDYCKFFRAYTTACGILTSLNDRPMSPSEPNRKEMHRGEVMHDALLGSAAVVYSIGFGRRTPLLRLSVVKMGKSPWEIFFRPLGPVNPCFLLVGRKFSPPHWSRELPCPQRSRALVPRSYL